MYKGILFVLAAASGTGKTTLAKALLKQDLNLSASVSYTTRPMRSDEKDGKSYHFVSDDKFKELEDEGYLLNPQRYMVIAGTAKTAVDILANGKMYFWC